MSKMNLKSKRGWKVCILATLITPRHLRSPNVKGSTSARIRARLRTSFVVLLAFAAGLEIMVSMSTLPCPSLLLESWTEEWQSDFAFKSVSSLEIQTVPLFLNLASRMPFAAMMRGICSCLGSRSCCSLIHETLVLE